MYRLDMRILDRCTFTLWLGDNFAVVHCSDEKPAVCIDDPVVTSLPSCQVVRTGDTRPVEFPYPLALAGLLGEDSIALFAAEHEYVRPAFDFGCTSDREIDVLGAVRRYAGTQIDRMDFFGYYVNESEGVLVLVPMRGFA